jgi:hypothetical protein
MLLTIKNMAAMPLISALMTRFIKNKFYTHVNENIDG